MVETSKVVHSSCMGWNCPLISSITPRKCSSSKRPAARKRLTWRVSGRQRLRLWSQRMFMSFSSSLTIISSLSRTLASLSVRATRASVTASPSSRYTTVTSLHLALLLTRVKQLMLLASRGYFPSTPTISSWWEASREASLARVEPCLRVSLKRVTCISLWLCSRSRPGELRAGLEWRHSRKRCWRAARWVRWWGRVRGREAKWVKKGPSLTMFLFLQAIPLSLPARIFKQYLKQPDTPQILLQPKYYNNSNGQTLMPRGGRQAGLREALRGGGLPEVRAGELRGDLRGLPDGWQDGDLQDQRAPLHGLHHHELLLRVLRAPLHRDQKQQRGRQGGPRHHPQRRARGRPQERPIQKLNLLRRNP